MIIIAVALAIAPTAHQDARPGRAHCPGPGCRARRPTARQAAPGRLVAPQRAQHAAARRVPLGYLARLQRAFDAGQATPDPGPGTAAAPPGIVEPLTSRELEVLRMLAAPGAPSSDAPAGNPLPSAQPEFGSLTPGTKRGRRSDSPGRSGRTSGAAAGTAWPTRAGRGRARAGCVPGGQLAGSSSRPPHRPRRRPRT